MPGGVPAAGGSGEGGKPLSAGRGGGVVVRGSFPPAPQPLAAPGAEPVSVCLRRVPRRSSFASSGRGILVQGPEGRQWFV